MSSGKDAAAGGGEGKKEAVQVAKREKRMKLQKAMECFRKVRGRRFSRQGCRPADLHLVFQPGSEDHQVSECYAQRPRGWHRVSQRRHCYAPYEWALLFCSVRRQYGHTMLPQHTPTLVVGGTQGELFAIYG